MCSIMWCSFKYCAQILTTCFEYLCMNVCGILVDQILNTLTTWYFNWISVDQIINTFATWNLARYGIISLDQNLCQLFRSIASKSCATSCTWSWNLELCCIFQCSGQLRRRTSIRDTALLLWCGVSVPGGRLYYNRWSLLIVIFEVLIILIILDWIILKQNTHTKLSVVLPYLV